MLGLTLLTKMNVILLLVLGNDGITNVRSFEAFDYVKLRMEEVGVNVHVKELYWTEDLCPELEGVKKYLCYRRYLRKIGMLKPRTHVHVIEGRKKDGTIGGYGEVCSYRSRFGISMSQGNAEEVNPLGALRWIHTLYIMIHEMGHAAGARHTADDTIMNTLLLHMLARLGDWVPWAVESHRQIHACMRRPFARRYDR